MYTANLPLVLKAVDRRWDTASASDEICTAELVDGHYRGIAEQSSERHRFSDLFAVNGDQPYCRGLVVYHAYSHLVGDYP